MSEAPTLPELLDLDFGDVDADLAMYEAFARRGAGPALDLGSGTGRVARPLAQAGIDVVGIENDASMIAYAGSKPMENGGARPQYICGDIRHFELDREFGLVFAAYGTFHHVLTQDDQLSCLRSVRRHLAADGAFVCDLTPMLSALWDPAETAPLLHDWTRALPRSGQSITKLRSVMPDRGTQTQHEMHFYDCAGPDGTVRRTSNAVDLRFVAPFEMTALLQLAGLEIEGLYGDYDLAPYNDASEYMITVARRGKESA